MVKLSNTKCSFCNRRAVIRIRYARLNLCEEHLEDYLLRKTRRVLAKVPNLLESKRPIVLAVSGGKDSIAMLYLVSRIVDATKIIAVHIDLGIEGYSKSSLEAFKKAVSELKVKHIIIDVHNVLGYSIPKLAKLLRRPYCSVCGMVKRWILNTIGLEVAADYIALGHTLDDIMAIAVKSLLAGDVVSLAKLGPYTNPVPGITCGRIRPLYEVTEKETLTYVLTRRLPVNLEPCPLRPRWIVDDEIKKLLAEIEYHSPGTKISFTRNYMRILDSLHTSLNGIKSCKVCGGPTSKDKCSFCRVVAKLFSDPEAGREVRRRIQSLVKSVLD